MVTKRGLSVFGDDYAERFYCILRDHWNTSRDRFCPTKRLKNTVFNH